VDRGCSGLLLLHAITSVDGVNGGSLERRLAIIVVPLLIPASQV
jgi:hypothetical protein